MIKVSNFSFSFPNKDLYNDVSFNIEYGQACAFIGSSGSGKSTLADIICDTERYMFDGKVEISTDCKIGYISQFYDVDRTKTVTVFEYIAQEFINLQDEIENICKKLETETDIEPLLEQYQKALDEFDAIDGNNYENNINKKLGLADLYKHRDLDVSKLSGGEFKLVQVIKQMLTRPHFIIMDEPDAFLDFENLNSLKNLINTHKGTTLTITHSRYLLNHCFNKILHLENKQIAEFEGRYIDYNFKLLEKKVELQELAFNDEEEIKRNEVIIDRLQFIAENFDSKANGQSLRARVKIQERLEARKIENPFIYIDKPSISFTTENVPEDEIVLSVEDFEISFADELLKNVNFEIKSTDKVAIIGANGTGKTTLMREVYKNNNDNIKYSDNTTVSYISQNQNEIFDDENTIFDEFFDIGFQTYDEITDYLKTFCFPEDKMTQKIGKLSGGEKNILGLAKISHEKSNLLILDEPTSHLDTYSQIALEEAIEKYNGAILMISHDFYTIVNCMDYVLIIEDKTIRKMQMRRFRKMIYAKHFDKDYLQVELNKKACETKIELALYNKDFESAKVLLEELAEIIKGL